LLKQAATSVQRILDQLGIPKPVYTEFYTKLG